MSNQPDPKKRTKTAPAAAVIALLAALGASEGLDYYRPYQDVVGIWTVCGGITGPEVIPGKLYSPMECRAMERRFVERMTAKMGKCVGEGLNAGEWKAWGHFTYNTGTAAFCGSTAARLLREGNHFQACRQMIRWDVLTVKGRKVHCSVSANRIGPKRVEGCNGIMNRREKEMAWCIEAQQ